MSGRSNTLSSEREISILTEKLNKENQEKEELKKHYKKKIDEVTRKLKEENLILEQKLHQNVEESLVKIREA